MEADRQIKLSPSKLNLFLECQLCFWLQEARGIHRPETPFSTLPSGMDLLIKRYFDTYRHKGELPPEIRGKVRGKLFKDEILNKWRHWQTGLRYEHKKFNALLQGALDECFVDEEIYIPVDYKTRGFDLKEV